MPIAGTHKSQHTFLERCENSQNLRALKPSYIPIVLEKAVDCKLGDIDNYTFLFHGEATVGQFLYKMRRRLVVPAQDALFLFVAEGYLPHTAEKMARVYEQYRDEDGNLYVTYTAESTFGWPQ